MTSTGAPGPTVAVFSLGGTIAMTPSGSGGVVPALSGAQLLEAVPELAESGIQLEVHDFRRLPGAALGFDDLLALHRAVSERLAEGVTGVVVTQGTDTIEETAYLLDLLHAAQAPLVVTGAMRHPGLAGADGPANVLAAVRTAACPAARGLGCLVVFADTVHAARFVRKAHSTHVAAFVSPDTGPIGHLVEGVPCILTRPAGRFHLPAPTGPVTCRVPVVPMALGDDGVLLEGLRERVDGLVIAAFGVGHVPAGIVDRLQNLAARVPVVLASRTGAGPSLRATYGFPGSETDLLRRGLISAGFLDPYKARVLLCLLLAGDASREDIIRAFDRAGMTANA